MKTNKLIIVTEDFSQVVSLDTECDLPKEKLINSIQQTDMFKNEKILDVVDANTHHICQYCGDIAKGTDADVLCDECREIFGHAFYSEL